MCECVWNWDSSRKSNPHKFSYTKNETEQIKPQPKKKKSSAVSVVAPPAWQSAS